jgi:ATP-dependent Clp protease ATP-binding subunit ClpX
MSVDGETMKTRNAYCSFCRAHYRDVGPLVEGPGKVYICAECVELCQSIIAQEKRRRQGFQNPPLSLPPPEFLHARLHSFIPSPETDLKAFAASVHSHYHGRQDAHRRKGDQNLLLLIGSSQPSAILLARVLAHVLDVPFASGHAENLTPSGPSPESGGSIVFKLLHASDFDAEAAQRGIVLLDGMDSRDAQEMLVNVLEERGDMSLLHALQIDLASILFVCLGAFVGLDEQIVRQGRHSEQPITSADLLAFGVMPEFVRRLRAVVRISPLDEETQLRLATTADLTHWSD